MFSVAHTVCQIYSSIRLQLTRDLEMHERRATSDESESLRTTNMISCDLVSSEDKADIKDIKPLVEYVEPTVLNIVNPRTSRKSSIMKRPNREQIKTTHMH